jgi:flagellar basal body-associated protein FliL
MDEQPKRTRGEMLAQLVVILLLMAVLVGAIFFLHQYVTSHSSAPAMSSATLRVVDRYAY